jgi:hypothetical protein
MANTVASNASDQDLLESVEVLTEALVSLRTATDWMLQRMVTAPSDALAGACAYLDLFGIALGGWLMVRRSVLARGTDSAARSTSESSFYATEILTRAPGLILPITAGARRLEGMLQSPFE